MVTNKFHLSQNFGNQRSLRQTGPVIKAQWRVTAETEEKLKVEHLHIPPPVRGFMVIDTSFVGTGIDAEVAQELNLEFVRETKLQSVAGPLSQPTYLALLLIMLGNVDEENLAIGGKTEAISLPGLRVGYDTYGLTSPEGEQVRIIGVLGRDFLQFTRFTYDGLNGTWEMEIDPSAMRL